MLSSKSFAEELKDLQSCICTNYLTQTNSVWLKRYGLGFCIKNANKMKKVCKGD